MCNLSVIVFAKTDYCDTKLCNGKKHIACNDNGKFGPQCSSDARIVPLTVELKKLILDTHNDYRDQIANGKINGYEKAARMATLKWDEELANIAVPNARKCEMKHDECRSTAKFKFAGQNLAWAGSTEPPAEEEFIKEMIRRWFIEYKDADMSYIQSTILVQNRGHFTQLVRDEAYAVGCAISKYKDKVMSDLKDSYLVCNYAVGNILNAPVYTSSSQTASGCQSGTNPQFTGLCSEKEVCSGRFFN